MVVTLEDIAKAAGVSRSTVSRSLADSPRVNVETRKRIQQFAREMGYLPNVVARGLTTKRTYNLGVLLLDITEVFVSELVRDIDHVARELDYRLVLSHCGNDYENVRINANGLLQRQVDAIIVADRVLTDLYLPLLQESPVPVIVINMREQHHPVSTDNSAAAKQGVNHLLDLGHQRIAYIGSARAMAESRERQAGYEQALLNRGISPQPALAVMPVNWSAPEAGCQGMEQLLKLSPLPTAVFCFNDLTAIGAIAKISTAGLNAPRDISVLGFDNICLAPYVVRALTTVAQQKERLAELAVETALNLIAGGLPSKRELLPGKLVIRDSTAPPEKRF